MTTIEVTPRAAPINFAPATVAEEVIQNVATILATVRYTVPYDRELGINPEYLDDPMPMARARATADVISAIRQYEPRCEIVSVDFIEDQLEGTMKPVVKVAING